MGISEKNNIIFMNSKLLIAFLGSRGPCHDLKHQIKWDGGSNSQFLMNTFDQTMK